MPAEQSLQEGKLSEALAELQDQVRKDPADSKLRVFLFQLLCILGDWDRANTQLNVSGDMDAGTLAMVQMYREALKCEVLRSQIFAGEKSPLVFGEPQEWVALLVEALKLSAQGKVAESQDLRNRAFEIAPTTSGSFNGTPFEWIADADMRLGPVVEAIINGSYYWVPIANISKISIEEPEDLRDLIWTPVHFAWANGGEVVGLIPTRYPGSETSEDDGLRLARKTDWKDLGHELFAGVGQRMFATDEVEYPLLEAREIVLDTLGSDGASETEGTVGE